MIDYSIGCAKLSKVCEGYEDEMRLKARTLPSDASSSFTGVSRTEATKQNDAGLLWVAAGYQRKSRMGEL
jgi:hypothetical protein